MGIHHFSRCDGQTAKSVNTSPNPNKYRYTVISAVTKGKWVLAEVHYPDATSYDGRKLMIFRKQDWEKCLKAHEMDPHFLPEEPTPVARFKPDAMGITLAELLMENLA